MKSALKALARAGGLAALMLGAYALPAAAADEHFVKDGYAIGGYDPVAYFLQGAATPGDDEYSLEHDGVVWKFASEENMATFEGDPDLFMPQYGGYCAFGTTFGKKVPVDPTIFHVVDDKLYLNSGPGADQRWVKDKAGNISKADGIWSSIVTTPAGDL